MIKVAEEPLKAWDVLSGVFPLYKKYIKYIDDPCYENISMKLSG